MKICRKFIYFILANMKFYLQYFCKKEHTMIIEKRNKEFIIRIPETVDTEEIQDFVDYIRYKELTSKAKKVHQSAVDKLTEEINKKWWTENRTRLLND